MSEERAPRDSNVDFNLSRGDLEDIAGNDSSAVPNVTFFGKTAFTIENAPIPKSVRDSIGVEKTITVQMKVRIDKSDSK
jgi:hypothetical protein